MIKYKLYNSNISNPRDHISNNIQFKYICHISDGTNRIVGDLDRFIVYTYLNIMDRDLAANCPVIHTILKEQTVQVGLWHGF